MDIKNFLRERRPNLSEGSVKTYNSIIKSIHRDVYKTDVINDLTGFNNTDLILESLADKSPSKRKTYLSALVVLTGNEEYRNQMNQDVAEYNKEIEKQELTPTQTENWIGKDDIQNTFKQLEKKAKLLYKKPQLTNSDLQDIQNYIIISLLGGIFIAPRRALDYTKFKIQNVDETKDNYYDTASNKLVFNRYKTDKSYGKQELSVPIKLKNILKKWKEINPTDYLLFDTNMNPLTAVTLNQRMNKIFGGDRGKSVNMMRHTYLTDKFKGTRQEGKNLERTMKEMGSSMNVADNYIKNNAPS
jgi:hypothetical protein